jgi:hypothetical protein
MFHFYVIAQVPLVLQRIHSKTNHIEVRYHFLRDNVEKGRIALIHAPTQNQLADIFAKSLDQSTFTRLWGKLGVCLVS